LALVGEGVFGRVDAFGTVVGRATVRVVVGAAVVVVVVGAPGGGAEVVVVVVVVVVDWVVVAGGVTVPQLSPAGVTETGSRVIVLGVYW